MDKASVLAQYMPPEAAPVISRWIDYFQCEFTISKRRTTKLGDYRHPFKGKGHKISVNNNLNPYAFLVTTVHEFAHLLTWNDHQHRVKPHGPEWKHNFKRMMKPFFDLKIFPSEMEQIISTYLHNPAASSCTDLHLARALKRYDAHTTALHVEEVPPAAVFSISDGRLFRKEEKVRKRYRCVCLHTGRVYLFNPLAEVHLAGS